jgi:hypothetical protein
MPVNQVIFISMDAINLQVFRKLSHFTGGEIESQKAAFLHRVGPEVGLLLFSLCITVPVSSAVEMWVTQRFLLWKSGDLGSASSVGADRLNDLGQDTLLLLITFSHINWG